MSTMTFLFASLFVAGIS